MADTQARQDDEAGLIGHVVGGKYRVSRVCGRGGMGAVYEAQNVTIGKRVALKFIDASLVSNRDGVQRFLREAQAASAVESAHIVQVFDVGALDDGRPYIVMELLRGETLGARLHRLGRLPVRDAVHVASQALRGLHRAHANGIVHRDLKPENLFLTESDDDPLFAKIVDFGISKITRPSKELGANTITQQGVVLGTPFYMAPEQAQALPDLDGRADLWSLGAILYECLAGNRPFVGDTYEQVIIAICTRDVPDIRIAAPEVPAPLAAVITKALCREREHRFQTAREFLDALRDASPELAGTTATPSEPAIDAVFGTDDASRAAPDTPGVHAAGTRTSWSTGAKGRVSGTHDAPASPPRSGRLRLAAFGLTVGALAFGATIAVVVSLRDGPVEDASGLVASASLLPASASVLARVITYPPDAQVFVDGDPAPGGTIRGGVGRSVHVRVEAAGFEAQDRILTLREGDAPLMIRLSPLASAASAPASSPPSATAPATPAPARPRPVGGRPATKPKTTGTSLTGGLELKTDFK